MKKLNNIEVIDDCDFVEGIIAEINREEAFEIELNEYYTNEFGERQKNEAGTVSVHEIYRDGETPEEAIRKLRKIAKNRVKGVRTKIYISEDLVDVFESVLG